MMSRTLRRLALAATAFSLPANALAVVVGNEDYLLDNFPSLGSGIATAGPPQMSMLTVRIKN